MNRLTWLGHATTLIELDGVRVLTDPVLRRRVAHLRRHSAAPALAEPPDVVLVSHLHFDHLDLPSLRRLGDVPVFAPRGAREFLVRQGYSRVEEIAAGSSAMAQGVEITAVRALHDGRRRPMGAEAEALGFMLHGGRSVYFAGDTDLFPEMADLPATDVALLPVWGWGPTLGEGHMDPGRAAQAAALLRPRVAVPIHWGTFYPRGLARLRPRPLREPPLAFAAQVATLAPDVEVRVLSPGGSLSM